MEPGHEDSIKIYSILDTPLDVFTKLTFLWNLSTKPAQLIELRPMKPLIRKGWGEHKTDIVLRIVSDTVKNVDEYLSSID